MSDALVGPLPTITFWGADDEPVRQAYTPPKHTGDLRARTCSNHHPACDCREAEWNESRSEMRADWDMVRTAVWSALQGHQIEAPLGLSDWRRHTFDVCLCTGCVIYRGTHHALLPPRAINLSTGRVRTAPERNTDEVPF